MVGGSKKDRLRFLASLTQSVPRTYWSIDAFLRDRHVEGTTWRIRSEEGTDLPTRALSTEEVVRFVSHVSPVRVAIQEYVQPGVSGATFISQSGLLVEAVPGAGAAILRDGLRGLRWAASPGAEVYWISGCGLALDFANRMSLMQVASLTSMSESMTSRMLEWILTPAGRFYWVDVKYLAETYVSKYVPARPRDYHIGGLSGASEGAIPLPSTRIEYASQLTSAGGRPVECLSGSPLAHLCVMAFESKVPLTVRETE